MIEAASGALLGLMLGARHAFEPDHLAAVSTLTLRVERPWQGALLGALWGVGHTLALLGLGGGLMLAQRTMPAWLAQGIEIAVALVMIGFGLTALRRAVRPAPKAPPPLRAPRATPLHGPSPTVRWSVLSQRTLLLGLVHGLGGSGPLMALAAAGLHGTTARFLYMGLFGLGSVAGMATLSWLLGWPAAHLHDRPALGRALALLAAFASAGIGVAWLWAALR